MTDIKATIAEVRRLDREADNGPWCQHPNGMSVWTGEKYDSESHGQHILFHSQLHNATWATLFANTKLITRYRTAAVELADECERLEEALQIERDRLHRYIETTQEQKHKRDEAETERHELNVTPEAAAWVISKVVDAMDTGPSFGKFVENMGFGPGAYSTLYAAGGMEITNGIVDGTIDAGKSVREAERQRAEAERERDDLRMSLDHATDALRIHSDINSELLSKCQDAMARSQEADHVIALSQLCCVTTGEQGRAYQEALDAYKAKFAKVGAK
jgi:hypothetical protein